MPTCSLIRVWLRYAVLQHNFDKRMEVKNSYMPLSCFAHVRYMYSRRQKKLPMNGPFNGVPFWVNGRATGRERGANGAWTGGERGANGGRTERKRGSPFPVLFGCAPASAYALCENERARATPFQADAKARMSAAISPWSRLETSREVLYTAPDERWWGHRPSWNLRSCNVRPPDGR